MSELSSVGTNNREFYGCGRDVKKYVRVDQEEGYCSCGYGRLFKKRLDKQTLNDSQNVMTYALFLSG